MALVVTKRCCNSLVIGECKLKQLKIPLYPIRQAKIRKADKAKCWQEDGEIGSSEHTDRTWQSLIKLSPGIRSCAQAREVLRQDQNRTCARLFVPPIVCGGGELKVIGCPSLREQITHRTVDGSQKQRTRRIHSNKDSPETVKAVGRIRSKTKTTAQCLLGPFNNTQQKTGMYSQKYI